MKWNVLRAVVTGAAGNLGRQLILDLGKRGVRVAAWDLNRPALEALTLECSKLGYEVQPFEVDITHYEAVSQAARASNAALGGIDLWFNYAGFTKIAEFARSTPEDLNRVVDVNLKGILWGTHAALEIMAPRGTGRIINMASVAGHIGGPYIASYSATKHAVVGFTRALQTELRLQDSGLQIVLVSPGFVDSQMIALGEQFGFPEWLKWTLASPEAVTQEVLQGLEKNKLEIFPTLNGRMMLRMQKVFPGAVTTSSRVLLTRSLKDLILNRYTPSQIAEPETK